MKKMNNLVSFKVDTSDKYTDDNNNNMLGDIVIDFITSKGRNIITGKIQKLLAQKPEIIERIKDSRERGNLEENEELHMALEDMQRLEMEVAKLNRILEKATPIAPLRPGSYQKVTLGMSVVLLNYDTDKEVTYTILGEVESDPREGIISYKSPLGRELIGSRIGDCIEIERAKDYIEYEILDIFVPNNDAQA